MRDVLSFTCKDQKGHLRCLLSLHMSTEANKDRLLQPWTFGSYLVLQAVPVCP